MKKDIRSKKFIKNIFLSEMILGQKIKKTHTSCRNYNRCINLWFYNFFCPTIIFDQSFFHEFFSINVKLSILHLIMHARDTTSHIQQHIIITKAQVKFQSDW